MRSGGLTTVRGPSVPSFDIAGWPARVFFTAAGWCGCSAAARLFGRGAGRVLAARLVRARGRRGGGRGGAPGGGAREGGRVRAARLVGARGRRGGRRRGPTGRWSRRAGCCARRGWR